MANTVGGGIRNSVVVGGAVRATVKNAMAHSGIASLRWNINAISYLLGEILAASEVLPEWLSLGRAAETTPCAVSVEPARTDLRRRSKDRVRVGLAGA